MSTSAGPTTPAQAPVATPAVVKVVSHTTLVYWWPVWLVGFILSALTALGGGRLAVVPAGTAVRAVNVQTYELVVPGPAGQLGQAADASARGGDAFPVRVSGNRDYGMVYVVVLLLVIAGTNLPLRGAWSLAAVLLFFILTLVLAYLDAWGWLLERFWALHVEISLAGYLLPSVVLLVLWLGTVFGLDRLRYVQFSAGQFVLHQEIGDSRQVFDATRVTLQKRRSDLLRHWVLGLGTGDLVITVPNRSQEIVLPNVAFVERRVREIADLLRVRPVTAESQAR